MNRWKRPGVESAASGTDSLGVNAPVLLPVSNLGQAVFLFWAHVLLPEVGMIIVPPGQGRCEG